MIDRTTRPGLLPAVAFGDPTAEADAIYLFDRNCFLETDIYERCTKLAGPLFIVGRRGSGKSATCMALSRRLPQDSHVLVVNISPHGFHFAHAKELARAMLSHADINWEFLFTSIWATTLRASWAQALLDYYRVRDTPEGDLQALRDFATDVIPTGSTPEQRLSSYLEHASNIISGPTGNVVGTIGQLLNSLRAEKIAKSIGRIAALSEVRLVTLIDGLDENWDGSDISAQIISGLLTHCATDFPATTAVSYVFLRENMYRRVRELAPRWDRIEGYFTPLTWSTEQLEHLVLTRLRASCASKRFAWNDVFEASIGEMSSLNYLISRTQSKPRELILFCRYALEVALAARTEKIGAKHVKEAERRYSENRRRDLLNEYQDALPELASVLDIFIGQPDIFGLDELLGLLRDFITAGRYIALAPRLSLTHPNDEALLDLLLGLGFLGVRTNRSTEFVFKYYGEQGNAFHAVSDIAEVAIHPAFLMALGMKHRGPNGHSLAAREVLGNELIGAASAVGVRQLAVIEHSGELISRLCGISTGMGGFKTYEGLVQEFIAFAFSGYLDNGRMQERSWAGAQVRDVVFDNTGETLFFSHVRNQYQAITFVFECKNKTTLEPADYHQIESRLSDTTGNLGFICYRSDRREPLKVEITQIRDIYIRSHGRKLALLLSDANLAQVLGKRTKGQLDRFMYGLLTRYRALYLT